MCRQGLAGTPLSNAQHRCNELRSQGQRHHCPKPTLVTFEYNTPKAHQTRETTRPPIDGPTLSISVTKGGSKHCGPLERQQLLRGDVTSHETISRQGKRKAAQARSVAYLGACASAFQQRRRWVARDFLKQCPTVAVPFGCRCLKPYSLLWGISIRIGPEPVEAFDRV